MNFQTNISCVIASDNPQKLSLFYASLLKAEICEGLSANHWLVSTEKGLKINIYKPSRKHQQFVYGARLSICFEALSSLNPNKDIDEWIIKCLNLGAQISSGPFSESFGTEAWMIDPEGNYFLLFVPRVKEV